MEYLGPLDGEIQFSGTTGRSATNNNPLNLEYRPGSYQDKYDAELEPVSKSGQQRFAKFPTMEMGYQAGIEQIQRRQKEGHTLASFVNQFAPPNENPTQEIIAQYSKALGVNPDTPLSDIPAEKVIIPMLARESGTKIVGKGGGVLKAVGNFLGPSSAEAATTGGGLKYLGPLEDEEPTGGQPKYLGPEPAGEAEIEPSEPSPFAGVTSLADNLALYIDPAADKDDLFTNSYADMLNNYTKGKLQNHSDAIENFVNGNTEKFDPFSQYSEQFTGSKYLPTINGLRSSANTLALGKGSLSLAPTLNTMLSKTIGDDSSYNIISRFERREDLPDIINTLFPIEGVVAGTALKLATSLALADTLNLKESEIDFNVVHEAIKKGGLDKKELATKTYEVLKDMYYVNRVPSMKQELTDRGKLNPLAEKLGRVSADEIEQTMIELSGGKAPDAVQKSLETAIKAGAPEVALAKDKLPDIRLAFKGLKAGFMGLVITAATGFDPVSAMTGMGVWPGEDNPVWDAPLNRKERRQLATETVLEAFFPDGIPKPKGMDELILFSAAEAIPAVLPLVIMSSAVGTIPAFATMGLLEDDPVKGALKGAALGTALKAMHFLGKSIQDQVLTWAYRMAGGASIGGGAAALEGGDAKAIGRGALVFTMFEAAGLPKLKLERLGLSEAEIKAFRDAVESQRVSQEAFDVAAKIPDIGTGERQPPTSVEPVKAEKPMSEEQARKAADEKYPKPKWVEIKKRFDAQTKDMEGKPLPEFKLFWEISHDMEVERRAEIILRDAARPRVEAATEATEALPTEAKAKEVEAFALDQKAAPAGAEAATAPRVYQDADGWWRVEGTEVKTSSQAVAEKAASQVKTLAPTIAPEPKVQQAAAGGVGPSGEAAPETIGGVRIKTSELPKSVFQQTLSEYLKNKKAVSQREIEITTKTHAKEVKYAISQGKPVPPEVLADYPDLAKQAGARAGEVESIELPTQEGKLQKVIYTITGNKEIGEFNKKYIAPLLEKESGQEEVTTAIAGFKERGLDVHLVNPEDWNNHDIAAMFLYLSQHGKIEDAKTIYFGHGLGKGETWRFANGENIQETVNRGLPKGEKAFVMSCEEGQVRNALLAEGKIVTSQGSTPKPAVAEKAIETESFEQYLERRKQFRQDVFNKAQDYLATGDGLWIGSYEKAINVINPDAIRTKNGEIQFYAGKKGGKYGGVEKWLPVPDNVLDNWAKEMGMKEFEQFKAQANAQEAGRGGEAFPAAKGKEQTPIRFETGKKLTKEQRQKVLESMGDVYKDAKLPKDELKAEVHGDPVYGYPYTPDLFIKSDITGKMIRHYITLPDGRIAHPSELFPDITPAVINRYISEAEFKARQTKREEEYYREARLKRIASPDDPIGVKNAANKNYHRTGRKIDGSYFSENDKGQIVRVDGKDPKDVAFYEEEGFKQVSQKVGKPDVGIAPAKQTQEEWVALQRPQKTRKPPTYDIQTAVAEGDIITLVRAHGRFDSQSSVIKDVTDPEERKYLLPFVVSKKRNPSVVSVDVFFEDIKNSYPGFFDEFESSADFVRFLVDKSAGRKLKFKSLEEEIAAHDAEIEERAAREGITPEALLGIEDTLEAEIAAAERAGRTESGAETLDLRDEWWTGEPFPEPGIALTGGKPKPSSITLRLDAIEADYPGIDRKKASVVLRTFPDAGDSQIVNMAADETMFRQVAKGSMTAYDKAQLLKKAGTVEVQQELPGTEGKEFDHLRGEAPAGAKPGGTKMYSGGPDTGPFIAKAVKVVLSKKPMAPRVATTPGAKAVEEMFDRSDAVSHAAKRTTWSKFASKLITMTWDVSGNIKRALWKEAGKEFGDEGKRVEMAMVAALGANTRSAQRQRVLKDTVYAGLDLDRSALLNHVITAKGAVIDPTLRHPDLVSPEKIPIEHYREFLADVAKSDPEVMRRADKFFDLMRENLTEGYEAGLITKKVYDDLSQYDYAMRRFEQYMGPYGTYGFSQKLSAGDPGFKALGKGSERLLETDVRLNAARALTTMQARIMDNQAAQAAWAMAKKYPDNSIFKIAKRIKVDPNEVSFSWEDAPPEYDMTAEPKKVVYKYEKLSPGEEYVKVRFDGKEKRLIVSAKYAGEWIKRDPAIRSAEAEIMGWLSGAKLLRATATGYNPSFAARNMPRDISHNWMVTQEYSLNPVKAAKQFAEDYKAVWHDAVHQTGAWVDFVNEGGGMEWLVAQGRIRNKYSGQLEGVQKYAGWVGQFSEIATRLAVRHRALLNGRTSAEATYIARTALDFGQGGSLVKTLDIGLPYLNAGVQATRTLFRAFTEAPGQTAVKLPVWAGTVVAHKMATIGLISAGLYIANNYWNKEAYDQVPAEVQENSWVVTTPLSYIDKNGDKRFIYFPIAKDQTQRLAATLFEGIAAKMMGHDYNWDKVKLAAEDLSIYIPWEKMPPTMAAFIGYATNKDFWRNRDIWRGPNVDPKEEFTPYTHPLAVKFGQATGLSPARMTYFFEQYIASSNLFSGLVGAGLRKIMETVPERDREKSMAELITGIPGLNTLVKSTDPMAQFRKPIADYQAASTTKSYKQWRDFDTLLEAYYAKPTREKLEKLIAFKNSQPEEDHDKLNRHYKEYGAYRTIPNSRFWMELKHASPEARANGFLYRFKTATPDEQRKLWNQAKELPGIVTERFVDELKKAQEGATQ